MDETSGIYTEDITGCVIEVKAKPTDPARDALLESMIQPPYQLCFEYKGAEGSNHNIQLMKLFESDEKSKAMFSDQFFYEHDDNRDRFVHDILFEYNFISETIYVRCRPGFSYVLDQTRLGVYIDFLKHQIANNGVVDELRKTRFSKTPVETVFISVVQRLKNGSNGFDFHMDGAHFISMTTSVPDKKYNFGTEISFNSEKLVYMASNSEKFLDMPDHYANAVPHLMTLLGDKPIHIPHILSDGCTQVIPDYIAVHTIPSNRRHNGLVPHSINYTDIQAKRFYATPSKIYLCKNPINMEANDWTRKIVVCLYYANDKSPKTESILETFYGKDWRSFETFYSLSFRTRPKPQPFVSITLLNDNAINKSRWLPSMFSKRNDIKILARTFIDRLSSHEAEEVSDQTSCIMIESFPIKKRGGKTTWKQKRSNSKRRYTFKKISKG